MGTFWYTVAKSIVEKYEKKNQVEKEKSEAKKAQIAEDKKIHDNLIKGFRIRYLGEIAETFKKTSSPEFKIGDTALTHWYGEGSYWDGSVQSLQSHTPFRGPIEVEITGVFLDTDEISEYIDRLNYDKDLFSNLETEKDYRDFQSIVEGRLNQQQLTPHWAYTIKVPNDENKYWCYTWRENKLLDPKSEEAKWSKKAFKNEQEYKSLHDEAEALREKIRKQVEKANKIKVLSR